MIVMCTILSILKMYKEFQKYDFSQVRMFIFGCKLFRRGIYK